MRQNIHPLLPLSGIAAPILYTLIVFGVGVVRPGYSHVTQSMSELGEAGAPYALVMNAGFMLVGLLMIAFAFALHRGIDEGSKIGPALVALAGASLVMVAFFPCDPGCIDISVTGTLHSIAATISAVAMILGVCAISQRLYRDDTLRRYSKYSTATGIAAGIVSLLLFSAAFENYMGAIQRISMAVPLLWMEVMGVHLFRLSWSCNNPCCVTKEN